jgi:protein-disulfide isomerase
MNAKKQQQTMIIAVVVVIAIAAVGALIMISGRTTASGIDFTTMQTTRLDDGGFVLGDPNAKVTIIEFADYGCPHCQEYKATIDEFIKNYVQTGKAKFEFRIFPTAGGQLTEFAGRIAECIDEAKPGSFWQVGERYYAFGTNGQYSDQIGHRVVDELGLDYSRILTCANNSTRVETDVALGEQIGVNGTPAVAVRYGDGEPTWIQMGGQTYSRGAVPYQVLAAVVDQNQ